MLLKTTFLLLMIATLGSIASAARAGDRLTLAAGRAGRSVTLATHGMVAASHPLAAQIGLDVLKNGGNAVDAAIAVNAALGLMEPMSCGIGGDLYALVWDAKTQEALRTQRQRPLSLPGDARFLRRQGTPGNSHIGTAQLVGARLCRWLGGIASRVSARCTLAQLLEPSIRYAEEGFPVSPSDRRFLAGRAPSACAAIPMPRTPT